MAALQKIRSKSGLLIGTIAAGLLAFVFPWNELTSFVNKGKDNAFSVNGEVVPTGKYSERIAKWEEFHKIMSREGSLDEATVSQIRESVYQQMVKEMMLDEQAKELGLTVTSEELTDMVYGVNKSPVLYQIPLFSNPQTGQFDPAVLKEFITDVNKVASASQDPQVQQEILAKKQVWVFIENLMKYQRLEEKYSSLVAGTVMANNTDAKTMFEDSKNVADIAYVVQRYTNLPDSSVQVSEKEIKALYDQRKNNYKLDTDLRKISYFVKDVLPSDEDNAVVEKEMNTVREKLAATDNPALIVNEYSSSQYVDVFFSLSNLPTDVKNFAQSSSIGEIYGPVHEGQSYVMYKLIDKKQAADSVRLHTINIPQGLDPKIVAHLSDSLYNVVKGGKDFITLANELQPGSRGGELGWFNEMMLSGAGIAKECFAASKGDLLKLTINGHQQLFYIGDKTNPVSKVKLAVVEMPVIISDKTQNAIDNDLNQFLTESSNVENFDKAALAKGYSLMPDVVIAPAEMSLGQIKGSRQVVSWAFRNKVGTVKKFDDMPDKRIVAIVKGEIKSDYIPMSEVTDALKGELVNDKKAEKMIADLKAKNLTSLDAYAQAVAGKVDTATFVTFAANNISGIGYEPILNVYSKQGQINKLEAPMKGKAGVYVMTVTKKTEDAKEFVPAQVKASLRQGNFYQVASQSIYALREKMNVKDNRVQFF